MLIFYKINACSPQPHQLVYKVMRRLLKYKINEIKMSQHFLLRLQCFFRVIKCRRDSKSQKICSMHRLQCVLQMKQFKYTGLWQFADLELDWGPEQYRQNSSTKFPMNGWEINTCDFLNKQTPENPSNNQYVTWVDRQ